MTEGATDGRLDAPLYPLPADAALAWAFYVKAMKQLFGTFSLEGLLRTQQPVDLREIYVPLALATEPVDETADEEQLSAGAADVLHWLGESRTLFVVGPPGCGKTTLTRQLVLELSSNGANAYNRALPDHLPVPLFLREYDVDAVADLDTLIDRWLARVAKTEPKLEPSHLQLFREERRVVLLLDGLDEVGSVARREKVVRLARQWSQPTGGATGRRGVVIATSRPSGLEGLRLSAEPLRDRGALADEDVLWLNQTKQLHVRPLTQELIQQFCSRWFHLPGYSDTEPEAQAKDLVEILSDTARARDLHVLARRPAFLTMIAFVQSTIGRLPDTRAQLYEQLVDAYLHQLDEKRRLLAKMQDEALPVWPREDKRSLLAGLGWAAQSGASPRKTTAHAAEESRLFSWERSALIELTGTLLQQSPSQYLAALPEHAGALIDYFLARTGLLTAPVEGQVQFGHLSFQEYLAAVHLHALASARSNKVQAVNKSLFSRLGHQGWNEVATLFMAIDASRTKGTGHRPLLQALDSGNLQHMGWLAELLGGREVRFSQEERRGWLGLVMCAHLALPEGLVHEQLRRLNREADNATILAEWFELAVDAERGIVEAILPKLSPAAGRSQLVESPAAHGATAAGQDEWMLEGTSEPPGPTHPQVEPLTAGTRSRDEQLVRAVELMEAAGASAYISDEALERAASGLPPATRSHGEQGPPLTVSDALFALDALVSQERPGLARQLVRACPLAVLLGAGGEVLHALRIAPEPLLDAPLRALGVACLLEAVTGGGGTWIGSRARSLARSLSRALSRALSLSRSLQALSLSRSLQALSLSRAQELALSLSRALSLEALDRALSLSLEALSLSLEALSLSLEALDRSLSRSLEAQCRSLFRALSLSDLLLRFALLAEGMELLGGQSASLTCAQLQSALDCLEGKGWPETAETESRLRELADCRRLGILPLQPLRAGLAGKVPLRGNVTFEQLLEELRQDIDTWCAAVEEQSS